MKVDSDITAERLSDGTYKIVNTIVQILDKKEMLNLVRTRQSMKENTLNKVASLKLRKKDISKEVAAYKAKTLGEINEEIVRSAETINLKAIENEVLVLNKATLGDLEMTKMETDIDKLIKEYQSKQSKLKQEADKLNADIQDKLKKI